MAKITKLPSGNWNTQVYIGRTPEGKKIVESITASTKDEILVKIGELKKKGKTAAPHVKTLRMAVEEYINLSAPILSPTTIASYRKVQEFAFQSIMDLPVADLTDIIMQNAINLEAKRTTERTGKPLSPKTIKNEWAVISSSLRTICRMQFVVRLPKVQHKNEELPEPSVVIDAIKGTEIELPCLLALWLGLRMSEIRGLDARSVHKNELWIDKVVVDVNGKPVLKHLAKTDSSIRKVKCPDEIMRLINNEMSQERAAIINDFVPLIPMTRNQIHHYFTRRMKACGIDMSFHDLRHLFASVSLTILQLPSKTVQTMGGWSTPDVMNRIYSQTFSAEEEKANGIRNEYYAALIKKSIQGVHTKVANH